MAMNMATDPLAAVLYARSGGPTRGGLVNGGAVPTPPPPACTMSNAELLADCTFQLQEDLRRVQSSNLVQHLAATQTTDGFTLTVWRAYADANRVAVAYTLAADDGRGHPQLPRAGTGPDAITLEDDAGHHFDALSSVANLKESCPVHPCSLPLAASTAVFDAAPLAADATEARLQFTIPGIEIADGKNAGPGAQRRGPWRVAFDIPMAPARVVETRQTKIVDGAALTLERVVVTPLAARLYVRGVTTGSREKAAPLPVLSGMARPPDPNRPPVSMHTDDSGLTIYQVVAPLYDQPGEWTVTFKSDPRWIAPWQTFDGRVWAFHLVVP